MNKENEYVYDNFYRLIMVIFNMVPLILGIIFLVLSNYLIVNLIGIIVIIVIISKILSLCFFKSLLIHEDRIIIKWFLFGEDVILKNNLEYFLHDRMFYAGNLMIKNNDNKIKSFLFMNLSLFALKYNSLSKSRKEKIKKLNSGVKNGN